MTERHRLAKGFLVLAIGFVLAPPLFAQTSVGSAEQVHPLGEAPGTLHYRAFHADTDSTLWRFAVEPPVADGALTRIAWRSEAGDGHREFYEVTENGDTPTWRVVFPERETDYTATRMPGSVRVVGTVDGRPIDETFPVDAAPVFGNVALGLAAFVRSGAESTPFWAFRSDDVSVVAMEARREAVETVERAGQSVPLVRVRWAPRGWRGWFWSRRFWVRPSDGVLVRTDERDGRITVLVDGS